uniref:Uncharacterized protein n=1 Tax=Trichogramma kaykai TaxID=54128 RepID=A0ABD2X241_9HYME
MGGSIQEYGVDDVSIQLSSAASGPTRVGHDPRKGTDHTGCLRADCSEMVVELQLGVDVQAQVADGGGRAYAVVTYRDVDGFHLFPACDEQRLRLVVSRLQTESPERASHL